MQPITALLNNNSARVPLTVIWILILLMSAAFSAHLSKMDREMAESLTSNSSVNNANKAYLFAVADLARGYLQYYKPGGPKNIVDNKHLSLIVNGALMLDQGLVFNSVDTASIIEYVVQSKRILYDEKDIDLASVVIGIELNNDSFEIDPKAEAANSTGA